MKMLILIAILCCLPFNHAATSDTLYKPSQFPFVRYDHLPKWFKDEMKTSKYLNMNDLRVSSVLDQAVAAQIEACKKSSNWTNEDIEFLLSPNNTKQQKEEKLYNNMPYCLEGETMGDLLGAQKTNISYIVESVIHAYIGYFPLNRYLRREKAEEVLPYSLLLHDALRYKSMPYNKGTIYRGGSCIINKINETIGKVVEVDTSFDSYSEDINVSYFFLHYNTFNGVLSPCMITMNLENDDHCAFGLPELSASNLKELLVPIGTRVKVLSIAPTLEVHYEPFSKKNLTYYNVTLGCADKTSDMYAFSIAEPTIKASSMFS